MEEWKKIFLETKQPPQKLKIALEYFDKSEGEWKERLGFYLRQRIRPAASVLISENAVDKLQDLLAAGWMTETIIDEMIAKAGKEHRTEITAVLLEQKRRSDADKKKENSPKETFENIGDIQNKEERICKRIWDLTILSLSGKYPFFRPYLCGLEFRKSKDVHLYKREHTVYFDPGFLIEKFCISMDETEHLLLHMMMHDLFLHTITAFMPDKRLWNLACDMAVKRLTQKINGTQPGLPPIREHDTIRQEDPDEIRPEFIYRVLLQNSLSEETLREMEAQYQVDDHRYWNLSDKKKTAKDVRQYWDRISKTGRAGSGGGLRKSGGKSDSDLEALHIHKGGRADFRRFLRRFAETGEEMQMDMEGIDYIPYLFGLEHYGNMPLVEHMEYSELRKLQELVIAIDTSGSCKTDTVRRFMEEVYSIFRDGENFFRKMNVYILQCDLMVQDAVHISCEKEWKEYMAHLVIHGRGDTDFQPVFRYVEELRREKKLKNLKCLMYFTDGDGIYPTEKTDYQTAFVFYHKKSGYQKAPAWAQKFDLEEL